MGKITPVNKTNFDIMEMNSRKETFQGGKGGWKEPGGPGGAPTPYFIKSFASTHHG